MDSCGEYVRRERRLWYLLCFLNRAQSKRQVSEREKENNQRRRSALGHEHIRVWGIRRAFEGLSSQVQRGMVCLAHEELGLSLPFVIKLQKQYRCWRVFFFSVLVFRAFLLSFDNLIFWSPLSLCFPRTYSSLFGVCFRDGLFVSSRLRSVTALP